MGMRRHNTGKHKGQSTLEYAILIAVVISVIIGMEMYLKRAMQGRQKDLADQQFGRQFDPFTTNLNVSISSTGERAEVSYSNGLTTSNITGNEVSSRTITTYDNARFNTNAVGLGLP